jgi:hypothetical protein
LTSGEVASAEKLRAEVRVVATRKVLQELVSPRAGSRLVHSDMVVSSFPAAHRDVLAR